jgi:type I restriction enzyme S subunit
MPADALLDFIVEVASRAVAEEAQGLIERAWVAEAESDVLAGLRDTLIPELLSGRLRVRDAEQVLEGAV